MDSLYTNCDHRNRIRRFRATCFKQLSPHTLPLLQRLYVGVDRQLTDVYDDTNRQTSERLFEIIATELRLKTLTLEIDMSLLLFCSYIIDRSDWMTGTRGLESLEVACPIIVIIDLDAADPDNVARERYSEPNDTNVCLMHDTASAMVNGWGMDDEICTVGVRKFKQEIWGCGGWIYMYTANSP